jgi:hypothetical protein
LSIISTSFVVVDVSGQRVRKEGVALGHPGWVVSCEEVSRVYEVCSRGAVAPVRRHSYSTVLGHRYSPSKVRLTFLTSSPHNRQPGLSSEHNFQHEHASTVDPDPTPAYACFCPPTGPGQRLHAGRVRHIIRCRRAREWHLTVQAILQYH